MNQRRSRFLAIMSIAAALGVPALLVAMRLRLFTFRDDFTGFNALGFALSWALVFLVTGTLLGGLAWHADRRSWLTRSALAINGALLAGLLWMLVRLGWLRLS